MSLFGSALQAELENAKGKTDKAKRANQEQIISKWIPDTKASKKKQFRDPASRQV